MSKLYSLRTNWTDGLKNTGDYLTWHPVLTSSFPFLVPQSSASKICAADRLSPAHRCTSSTNCPSPWPSSLTSSLSRWPTAWTQSWCTDARTRWPTARHQAEAAAPAKPTVSSAQSPSGLRRALQRTRRHPLRGTVRSHSEGADYWLPPKGHSVKVIVAPKRSRGGTEEQGEQPGAHTAVNWHWPLGNCLEWLVWCLFSLRLLVPSCGYPCTRSLRCRGSLWSSGTRFPRDQQMWIKDHHSPVNTTNEWRDIIYLLYGNGVFIVFNVGLEVVNILYVLAVFVCVWWSSLQKRFSCSFCLECFGRPAYFCVLLPLVCRRKIPIAASMVLSSLWKTQDELCFE